MAPTSTIYRLILLAAIAVLTTPIAASGGLLLDLRAVSASGGAHLIGPYTVELDPVNGGQIVLELWGVVTGANTNLADDRVKNFAMKFLISGGLRGNLSRPAQWTAATVNDPATVGVALTHRDPGANNGNAHGFGQ